MLIEYFSDGLKLYARVYDAQGYAVYTMGWLDDGTAEKGVADLHWVIINSSTFAKYHAQHRIKGA